MAHLLLVDDDDALRRILALLLSRAGHTVVEAADGESALADAAQETFDLIVADVMMPGLDGYALTRRLRAQPATRATPVLLMTASLRGPDAQLARAAGADAHMTKTTNPGRLCAAVDALLAGPGPREDASAS